MSDRNRRLAIVIALVLLTLVILGAYQVYRAKLASTPQLPSTNPITVSGEIGCLPHRDKGNRTLECEYGISTNEGKRYALINLSGWVNSANLTANNRTLTVIGKLTTTSDSSLYNTYDVNGIIDVESAELLRNQPLDSQNIPSPKQITIDGEIVCLPHRDKDNATLECAMGLKADADGFYYGLNGLDNFVSQMEQSAGRKLKVSGSLDTSKSDFYNKYAIVGVISITAVE